MWGTIVNALAVILGTTIGCLLKKGIPEKVQKVIMQALGLSILIVGFTSALKTENILLLIISLALGSAIGNIIGIEQALHRLGTRVEKRFAGEGENTLAEGFVTATLVFCVGALAVLGPIEAGTTQNYQTLYIKSLLDGVSSIVFSSALGIGVGLAAIPLFIYQGTITLCAKWIAPLLTEAMLVEISAIGGTLVIGIGLNILNIKKINVADMLPSILIPPIYFTIYNLF